MGPGRVHGNVRTCMTMQWNLSIGGPRKCVLIREVSLFQRLICTQEYTIGTSETVLIREVSLLQVSFKRGSTVVLIDY